MLCLLFIYLCCGTTILNAFHLLNQTEVSTSRSTTAAINACSQNPCPETQRVCLLDAKSSSGYKCCKSRKKCEKIFCIDPGPLVNGYKLPERDTPKFLPGEKIICNCYYFQSAADILECLPNGTWNNELPQCLTLTDLRQINNPPEQKENVDSPIPEDNHELTVIIVGVPCICLLLIGISGWFLYNRKCKRLNSSYMRPQRQGSLGLDYTTEIPKSLADEAIRADAFMQYVALRHGNSDQAFKDEFKEVQNFQGFQPTWEASKLYENKEKNRYTNIVAYDHTRVRLRSSRKSRPPGLHRTSDYINANYVSSFRKPKAYIACQGPLPSTFNDFWKMIWDNNTTTIVMITNLVEKGRRKCDQYWPQEGKEQYKHITVSLKSTETYASYTVRVFSIKNAARRNSRGGERKILQYHFTQWFDHGTPEYLLPVLSFIRRSFNSNPVQAGPIVVHCSAGVGRTGTYIVIHSMMEMLEATGSVNIKGFLRHIRMQRNHLVQTEEQYVFVHDALLEYIISGISECSLIQLPRYYQHLTATGSTPTNQNAALNASTNHSVPNGAAGDVAMPMLLSGLERQFMKVVYSRTDVLDYDESTRTVNTAKNRPGSILPVYRSRVSLFNRTSAEGSDYVNASFVQGYRNSHEFIVTQLPLQNTLNDFWQLVWDHNCSTVVTIKDNDWVPDVDPYWPTSDRPLHCPSFNVTFSAEAPCDKSAGGCHVTTRDFILEATKDDYVLMVKQFELSDWNCEQPGLDQLDTVSAIVKFTAGKEGSTVVQDRYGGAAAIQLACWHYMQCKLNNENQVDVYQTAAVACQMRPKAFASLAHYKFLYEAIVLEGEIRTNPVKAREKRQVVGTEKVDVGESKGSSAKTSDLESGSSTDIGMEATETDRLVA